MLIKKKQKGISLIEIMIALVLSLLVVGMVISMFSSSIGGHAHAIKGIRLNQDLRIAMDMMIRDMRRAGYWNSSANVSINPHATTVSGATPIAVFDVTVANDCVFMSYDLSEDGTSAVDDFFGYRWNSVEGDLEVYTNAGVLASGAHCGTPAANQWISLIDVDTIQIEGMSFATSPVTAASFATAVNKTITVTLIGSNRSDPNIRTVLVDEVRIRNEFN